MEYWVYIIRSKSSGKYYTGITDNLERRLKQHNRVNSKSIGTRKYTDFEYVYTEKYENRLEARKREKFFKSGAGREFRQAVVK